MTSLIRIIFILSLDVLICNLPESHGVPNNQEYHLSTISQVLTPGERFKYEYFGTLPKRIYYSSDNRCYVVRGQTGRYKNDLVRKNGKRYKAIPRWKYYLDKLSSTSLIKSGIELVSIGRSLVSGGGFDDFGDGDDDIDGGADGDVDIGTDDDADGATDDAADNATDDAADDDEHNKKEPGLLSKGIDMGMGLMSPPFNLFDGSKGTHNDNNDKKDEKKDDDDNKKDEKKDDDDDKKDEKKDDDDDKKDEKKDDDDDKKDEKKDDDNDNKEDDTPADSKSYMDMAKDALESDAVGMAKDVLQSDTAKGALKTGISMFVPGGPAIVAAMEAAEKYQKADAAVDKMEDKIPKFN